MSKLLYKTDAGFDWNKALPVGNGRLGAMIFGGRSYERLQLNEDSLWYGGPMERINQDSYKNLEKIRKLIFDGKIKAAEDLILHSFSGNPPSMRPYQPFGELYINYRDIVSECEDYERVLDIDNSVHIVKKRCDNVLYTEKIIASYPDNSIVINITTDNDEPFNADIDVGRMNFYDRAFHDERNMYFCGNMPGDNYSFCGGITAYADSGNVECIGQYIVCRNVINLTILFTAATSYREPDPQIYVKNILDNLSKNSFECIYDKHLRDYKALYDHTKLFLQHDEKYDYVSTDERLEKLIEGGSDNGLINTYFDFGKYLLISSSREGSLPANLQGVWCKDLDPPWGCKYTININTQMNYWPAELLGLGKCHLPLFELMLKMSDNGRKTAEKMYGCRGIVAHHNTDLWGDCAPQDLWIPGTYWVMSIPWLCTHIMKHYEYSSDKEFVKKMYPFVKESVLFFHDFLVEKNGMLCICPSVSPENTYILPNGERGSICFNSTMDVEILRDHFKNFLKLYEIYGDDDEEFYHRTEMMLEKLPELKIGKHGQIMEWVEDYEEAEPGHRHISQLYALYPSDQITVFDTPELADACRKTIERRLSFGGGHTGWSRAWIMNMYARLWEGEKVYDNLMLLLKQSTLTNLFDNHPPFQIDGNFGSVAAICEAFVQTNKDRVFICPALSKRFGSGKIENLCIPGGGRVSIVFKDGNVIEFTISSLVDNYSSKVFCNEKEYIVNLNRDEAFTVCFN